MISRRKFIGNAAALSTFLILPRHVLGGKGFTAPSDKINLGFIGAGRRALNLKDSFKPIEEVRIAAACDVYKSKVDSFCAGMDCKAYHNFTELLAQKDIDAVVIATPDHWHAAMAVKAAAAGKDIYCEKPLSLTVVEGRKMVDATLKYKRVFQTGSMQRSRPEFRQAVELIRNGYIGEIKNVKVSIGGPPVPYNLPAETVPADLDWNLWLGPNEFVHYNHELNPVIGDPLWGRWRDFKGLGGGDITDWGAHMFDIVQWALDMDHSGPVEFIPPGSDVQHLTMKYANGVIMTHEDFGKQHAIQFNGTSGVIEIQRGKLVTTPDASLRDKVVAPKVYHSDNHYKDFLKAIRDRSKPVSDIESGHRSASVGNLANIAYDLKVPLKWDPEKEVFVGNEGANKLLFRKMKKEWAV
ncbi:gfo/Idh/MocA family oxidoreductase [Chitinophaga sp. SYP-B3965]|uniref:Gfo/Idh/MocA family protein n=1 Tax=Chitinophaga sp. SYP-B3965 TaxID=2663120 RepID=UPI00129980FD|nr:Gfo/Idh/MocA family oxidoreductase [Chitinophaga sp. SYP-B3965]MRG46899.1 gfo/Idh/MocA family oxidoreductase [Chitinophaga sp. SYP-B3965]